jgi:hypothetical protein
MWGIHRFGVVASLAWLFGISFCLGAGPSPSSLIEPGLRVGQVRIGESRDAVHGALGNSVPALRRVQSDHLTNKADWGDTTPRDYEWSSSR